MTSAALVAEPTPHPPGSWIQPVSAGLLAAIVGFASTFTIVLQGLARIGASPGQAASGLLTITREYVQKNVGDLAKNADLSRFILLDQLLDRPPVTPGRS